MENKNINIWVVRPKPDDKNRSEEFIEENIIAIGWDKLPDLKNKNKNKIEELLEKNYPDNSSRKLSLDLGMIDRFVNEFSIGDIVFVPDDDVVHIAEIENDYKFNKNHKTFPHCRKIKWLKTEINKNDLPENLQSALKSRMSIYSITKNYDDVAFWFNCNARSTDDIIFDYSDKLKAAIGIEAIEYVGTYSQTHYDVIYSAKKEFIPKGIRDKSMKIVKRSKVLLETNDSEKFDDFHYYLLDGRLTEKIIEEKNRLYNKYMNEILELIPGSIDDKEEVDEEISIKIKNVMKNIENLDSYFDENISTNLNNEVISQLDERVISHYRNLILENMFEEFAIKLVRTENARYTSTNKKVVDDIYEEFENLINTFLKDLDLEISDKKITLFAKKYINEARKKEKKERGF